MSTNLIEFADAADALWAEYLRTGPGTLKTESLVPFDAALAAIRADTSAVPDKLQAVIAELDDLLHRCVERTEGLSFVTGEAGLIPRRDLHDKCEAALAQLRRASE